MKRKYDLSDAEEIYEHRGIYRKLAETNISPNTTKSASNIKSESKEWVSPTTWTYHSFSSQIQSKNNDSSEKVKKQPGMKILSKMFKSFFMSIQKNTEIFNECSVAEVVNKVT
jgi:hypothetical protein